MAATERQAALTAEYLKTCRAEPAPKKEKRGRPALAPPPPEPPVPPLPVFEPRADDQEPSTEYSLAFRRYLSRGEVRGLENHAAVNEVFRAWNELHWAWRQDVTKHHQRNHDK